MSAAPVQSTSWIGWPVAYGATAAEALAKAEILALRVIAERLEQGEAKPRDISVRLPAAA